MAATSGLFRASRFQLYGYAVAAIYVLFLVSVYRAGTWILDTKGVPIYTDFACAWAAALEAIQGQAALLYDPAKFVEMQAALIGPGEYFRALCGAALFTGLPRLGCAHIARRLDCRVFDSPAPSGDCPLPGLPLYLLELLGGAQRVPDRLAARRLAAVS
jgi:hypothetical protein